MRESTQSISAIGAGEIQNSSGISPTSSHSEPLVKSRDREKAYQLLGGCEVFAHRIAFEDFALRPEDGVRTVEIDCPWIKGPTPLLIVQDSKDEWKNVFVKVM